VVQVRIREGDFIETSEGLIFDVKGIVHPPDRAIAYLRYYPNPRGSRVKCGVAYAKVYDLAERLNILQRQYPQYLFFDTFASRQLQGVPMNRIQRAYQPIEQLQSLRTKKQHDALEGTVISFTDCLQRAAQIKASDLGISGSVQIGLHGPESDIDLIVYGRQASREVQLALQRLQLSEDADIKGYQLDTYQSVYDLRWAGSEIPLPTMLELDGPKAMHGLVGHHHYFVRAVLDWNEVKEKYGDRKYQRIGIARAHCRITDHRDSLFTPCRYEVDDVEWQEGVHSADLREIVSFRGRFTEHARQDDLVVVQGMVELVQEGKEQWSRFVLGEQPTDILIPRNIL
jgi:predicted nucleotidyltransferase